MANNGKFLSRTLIILLGVLFLVTATAGAEVPFAAPQMAGVEGPLAVMDVVIDKTGKNAVASRSQAIIEAQHRAFERLMERSLPADRLRTYQLPDDKTISSFVENFEIKSEQISASRYIANFTVRFNAEAARYVESAGGTIRSGSSQGSSAIVWEKRNAPMTPVSILVLPYLKNNLGKDVLWEDPNPWREAWQKADNTKIYPGLNISVVSGDANDLSSGSSDAVWAGDYTAVERLRQNYKSDIVVLPVAYRSDTYIQVDVNVYRNGRMERKKSLPPYNIGSLTGIEDAALFQKTIPQVVSEMRSMGEAVPPLEDGLQEIAPALKVVSGGPQLDLSLQPEHLTLESTMAFNSFEQWVEAQKLLSAVSPSVRLDISSLSKNAAWFTITADIAGGFDEFRILLAGKAMEINMLPPEQSPSGRPLYVVKMN